MAVKNENYSFLKSWSDIYVDEYERTSSVMSGYHSHDYYEVSLILSGEVRAFTPGVTSEFNTPHAVLCAPGVPHYITCTEGTIYRRINVVFSEEFVCASGDFDRVKGIFKKDGSIIPIDKDGIARLVDTVRTVMKEEDRFRCRLLLLYYLSLLSDMDGEPLQSKVPEYVFSALNLIKMRFSEKIIAGKLAEELNVGRTTLMNNFKRYTGMTLGEYILKCRLIAAIELLNSGISEREVAERCGFGESSSLVRSFKHRFGIPPKKYLLTMSKNRK